MGKLKALAPRLKTVPAKVSTHRDEEGHNAAAEPLRNLYNTAAWRSLRLRVFKRDRFTCQLTECGRLVSDTSDLVADHIIPHRGDLALFWSEDNVWTLCRWCHSAAKQRLERAARPSP